MNGTPDFVGSPLLKAYAQYSAMYPDLEVIGSLLYDTFAYVSGGGGTVLARFFNVGPRASLDLTNMEQASVLTGNKAMLVRAFRFYVKQLPRTVARAAAGVVQTGAISNIALLINTGVVTLLIGDKPYATFPLWTIPSGAGQFGMLATDGNTADPGEIVDAAICGVPSAENALILSQPLFIPPQTRFEVDIAWPAALTLEGGNTNITFVLDGDLVRPVQ